MEAGKGGNRKGRPKSKQHSSTAPGQVPDAGDNPPAAYHANDTGQGAEGPKPLSKQQGRKGKAATDHMNGKSKCQAEDEPDAAVDGRSKVPNPNHQLQQQDHVGKAAGDPDEKAHTFWWQSAPAGAPFP
eukprot:CAMPEP_0202913294 /NCGR_PEP_ID=MMETSP1392-20130828/60120_1 /ASSEMBLY_ACC=CAM_ASM_000868 /TAXON_ID=225041 /ORGANISM="Chlamydomonas chlamydogama, Strain SAG 11-48b" /LENGTH=128 /DNA_ID=CAMNT_0049604507 /DNA_START=1 /DNA_END=383 /DNA_ORIENTATION=-